MAAAPIVCPHVCLDENALRLERTGDMRYTWRAVPPHATAEARILWNALDADACLDMQALKWSASFGSKTNAAIRDTRGALNCLLQAFDTADAATRHAAILAAANTLSGMRNAECKSAFRPKGDPVPGSKRSAIPRRHVVSDEERAETTGAHVRFCIALDIIVAEARAFCWRSDGRAT